MFGREQKQERKYQYPYHHIPHFGEREEVIRYRFLSYGFEYFCYLLYIKEIIENIKPDSVLDIGCGDGRLLGILSSDIKNKTGVDFSSRAIGFADAFYPSIDFVNKDAREVNGKFEVVVAMEVLEHIPDKKIFQFFNLLEKRIGPRGYCIISVPTKVKPLQEKHYRHYNRNLFQKQLRNSGVNLKIENIDYIFKESLILNVYKKITFNRFYLLEVKWINEIIWQYVIKKLQKTGPEKGQHMVVTLRKL